MKMEKELTMEDNKILYLYGSGRNAATRTQRHGKFPRELVPHIGPWIVRPARSVAVNLSQLAAHLPAVLEKVEHGSIQVKTGDGTILSLDELKTLLGGAEPVYASMSHAELLELARGETVSVKVLGALIRKTPFEDRRSLVSSLTPVFRKLAESDLQELQALSDSLEAEQEAHEEAEREAEREKERVREEAEHEAEREERRAIVEREQAEEAKRKANEPPPPPVTLPAPPDTEDSMDFSDPGTEEAPEGATEEGTPESELSESSETFEDPSEVSEEPAAEEVSEAASDAAEASDAGLVDELEAPSEEAAPARTLPEDWRGRSNAKLIDLINENGVTMPERKNKQGLTDALEAWLAGGS